MGLSACWKTFDVRLEELSDVSYHPVWEHACFVNECWHTEKIITLQSFHKHSTHKENVTQLIFRSRVEVRQGLKYKHIPILVTLHLLLLKHHISGPPGTRTKLKVRPAHRLESDWASSLFPSCLQRLEEAVSVASESSLKFGALQPWNPNYSSGC